MMTRQKRPGLIPLFLSLLFPALAGLSACADEDTESATPRPVKSVVARLATPEAAALPGGLVRAHTEVAAAFQLGGRVAERFVATGDPVKKGQKLARLDDAMQRDTLNAAKASVAAARATSTQSRKHAERTAKLVKDRAVSRTEQEVAERQYLAAKAQLEAAQAQEHTAEEQLGYTLLRATVDGLVTARLAESGEVVAAGQPVFRLAAHEGRDAVFDAPESLLPRLRPGSTLQVCLESDRAVCSPATVHELAPEADKATNTYQFRALIENADRMPLGASLSGTLPAGDGNRAISVPATALFNLDGKPALWVYSPDSSTVNARPIVIGDYGRDSVIVNSGLQPGEIVVTAGAHILRQGQKVRLMNGNNGP